MKIKILVFAFMALSSLFITSSSKDDDNKNNNIIENSYTYDGKKHEIKWAGYEYYEGNGYTMAISPMVTPKATELYNENDLVAFDFPIENLGIKNNIGDEVCGDNWCFYGFFINNGDYHYF